MFNAKRRNKRWQPQSWQKAFQRGSGCRAASQENPGSPCEEKETEEAAHRRTEGGIASRSRE